MYRTYLRGSQHLFLCVFVVNSSRIIGKLVVDFYFFIFHLNEPDSTHGFLIVKNYFYSIFELQCSYSWKCRCVQRRTNSWWNSRHLEFFTVNSSGNSDRRINCDGGDSSSGSIIGSLFWDPPPPPLPLQSVMIWYTYYKIWS